MKCSLEKWERITKTHNHQGYYHKSKHKQQASKQKTPQFNSRNHQAKPATGWLPVADGSIPRLAASRAATTEKVSNRWWFNKESSKV